MEQKSQVGCELKITEKAAVEFKQMCIGEDKHWADSYLRIGANSGGCSGWKYSLDYEDTVDDSTDLIFEQHGVKLVVDGLEIDWSKDLSAPGPRFQNPRATSTCGCSTSFSVKQEEVFSPAWMQ